MIKRLYKKLLKKYRLNRFNKKHNVKIRSLKADLKAKYGNEVRIGEGTWVSKKAVIGDFSYVNSDTLIGNCKIGKYCSISSNVAIGLKEHNYNMITTHPILYDKKYQKNGNKIKLHSEAVEIGNDVWIGLGVVVLSGVKVGNGAVLGAGSIVTKDVPPYSIVGGSPAKVIKYRFDEEKIREIQESEWWDWSHEKIMSHVENFRQGRI